MFAGIFIGLLSITVCLVLERTVGWCINESGAGIGKIG